MTKAEALIPKDFWKTHEIKEGTAASVLADMAAQDLILFPEEAMPDLELSEEEAALAEEIRVCTDPEQLVKWMRKTMTGLLRARLLRRALAYEKDVLPLLQRRALTTRLVSMEDCASMFAMVSKKNPCPWIMENYENITSEFLKSQFCLVLGMRGTPKYIPFLLKELERFEHLKAEEQYLEQGPLLGLSALSGWPDERDDWEPQDAPTFFDMPFSVDLPEELTEEEFREQTKEGSELYEKVKAQAKEYLDERMKEIITWYEEGEPLERIAVEVGLPEEVVFNMVHLKRDDS
ncbi:MAG: hypothetical protein IJ720_02505 [Clostridia bacterium]|nr:hypothetical protein [Clostridia bacterium]MBR1704217.1 hypothetical protein [Clostridia bacterium]